MKHLSTLVIILLMGCLKPEKVNGPDRNLGGPVIEDNNLLAGATSSTNWPQEDGGSQPIAVSGRADSVLVLRFRKILDPVNLGGRISVFKGGVIPALESTPYFTVDYPVSDSIAFPLTELTRLQKEAGTDTVSFTLRIESDTLECLLLGFSYSLKLKKFISSPFSVFSGKPFLMSEIKYFIKGVVDSSIRNSGPYLQGKTEWCFYIPGSPYFWKAGFGDTLQIGPVPFGVFPFRLLKVLHPDGNKSKYRLEAYEVKMSLVSYNSKTFLVKVGEQIFSFESTAPISIRSDNP
ncbi:MAG: hypothetical protein M3Y08_12940 [Fibrobacterota bacterium]|nr:hypothetical protein [Fibrobacterota bacterium]